jgi:DNA polymerase I-like protein with 3'-5' exonuclease and polymerase domains
MSNKKDKDHYDRYGWMTNEENLQTLPTSAPQAAKDLVKWLTLEGRRKALTEWLKCCEEDGKIHGKYWPIGAWTHRMSHSAPAIAPAGLAFRWLSLTGKGLSTPTVLSCRRQ